MAISSELLDYVYEFGLLNDEERKNAVNMNKDELFKLVVINYLSIKVDDPNILKILNNAVNSFFTKLDHFTYENVNKHVASIISNDNLHIFANKYRQEYKQINTKYIFQNEDNIKIDDKYFKFADKIDNSKYDALIVDNYYMLSQYMDILNNWNFYDLWILDRNNLNNLQFEINEDVNIQLAFKYYTKIYYKYECNTFSLCLSNSDISSEYSIACEQYTLKQLTDKMLECTFNTTFYKQLVYENCNYKIQTKQYIDSPNATINLNIDYEIVELLNNINNFNINKKKMLEPLIEEKNKKGMEAMIEDSQKIDKESKLKNKFIELYNKCLSTTNDENDDLMENIKKGKMPEIDKIANIRSMMDKMVKIEELKKKNPEITPEEIFKEIYSDLSDYSDNENK